MSISTDIISLAETVIQNAPIPDVSGIHLPPITQSDEIKDEFGFIFLQDGSVGPFYVSLPELLPALWQRYPDGKVHTSNLMSLINALNGHVLAERAVAIGAFNALSQHLFKKSGYFPTNLTPAGSSELSVPVAGEMVGMVGYFSPVVRRFLEQGVNVLVLEKNPQRVTLEAGVSVTTTVNDLAKCQHIVCTACTLINDTLESILNVKSESAIFSLIGPSGSGLPDVLFKHGVDAVGGVHFPDITALQKTISKHESWRDAGDKYHITAADYLGVTRLIGL
ncbi:MAG: hypothetical protein HUJ30_07155 [Gammaproteobacteria bacterium]|nr:hypothetical protein [Gammaproteobacteria bacterium]